MKLSKYQQDILEAVKINLSSPMGKAPLGVSLKTNLIIEALAGTGKSTMLWLIAAQLQKAGITADECAVLVFGKKNQKDLQDKFEKKVGIHWGECVRTLHSLVYELYRNALRCSHKKVSMQSWKYQKIGEELGWLSRDGFSGDLCRDPEAPAIKEEREFMRLLDLLRLYCYEATVENVKLLNKIHKLTICDSVVVAQAAKQCLAKGEKLALSQYWIDQTDMVWIPWQCREDARFKKAIASKKQQLKFLACDEAQDIDTLQLEMMKMLLSTDSFFVGVGDRFQAVYLFRGAMNNGMDTLKTEFNTITLPLPVNYRCGTSQLKLIRDIYSSIPIQPHEAAPEGEVRVIQYKDFLDCFEDMSLSYLGIFRKNAPMTKAAIQLLAAGKPAVIKDKNIGNQVKNLVKQICAGRGRYTVDMFPDAIQVYSQERRAVLSKMPDSEIKLADYEDMMEAIWALFEAYTPFTLKDWELMVDGIFKESGHAPISFYTIHSGKGGEGQVTFFLYPEETPLAWKGQSDEELAQEHHMIYVANSRTLADGVAGSGVHYLVLRDREKVQYPSWLPREYCQLWKEKAVVADVA